MEILLKILDYIGSAVPLIILSYMIVFIMKGKKIKSKTIVSYIVVAVLMFIILLRTS